VAREPGFLLDRTDGVLADVNELHADADSGKRITDLAARLQFQSGSARQKLKFSTAPSAYCRLVLMNIPLVLTSGTREMTRSSVPWYCTATWRMLWMRRATRAVSQSFFLA
jgi:hypothetical protein